MRWSVEEKLRFIKQYKKDRTVENVDGYTQHTMLNHALKDLPKKLNLIFHSDQGWQYQMKPYQRILRQYGITQSMSRKGNCLDNAKMEGFFGLLKREMFYGSEFHYHSFNQFKRALINYINWYNKERIKLALKMSPTQYRLKYYN